MTKEEFAKLLDGREHGEEMTSQEETLAFKNGLVVVFGYGDDNTEFRGAINDEASAFDGTTINVDQKGVITECECACECRKCSGELAGFKTIYSRWDHLGYSWFIEIEDVPFATFEIFETDEDGKKNKFCRGIVFDYSNL